MVSGEDSTARQGHTIAHARDHACAAAQIADLLTQLVTDTDVTMEVSSFAAVALGLTFVGTCHAASVEAMLQVATHAYSCSLQQRLRACSLIIVAESRAMMLLYKAKAVTCPQHAGGSLNCPKADRGTARLWLLSMQVLEVSELAVHHHACHRPQDAAALRPGRT